MKHRTTVVSTTVVSRPQPADLAGEDGEGYRSEERPVPAEKQTECAQVKKRKKFSTYLLTETRIYNRFYIKKHSDLSMYRKGRHDAV